MPNERNLRNAVPNFGLIVGAAASLVLVVTFFFMWERIYTLYKIPPNFQAANNSKPSTALNSAYKSQERNHVSNSNYSEKTPKSLGAPFDEATAQKLQQEWAEFLELPIELENSLGMKFRLIPPGEFAMGFNRIFAEELSKKIPYTTEKILASTPENRVRITYPFYVQVHEVTQRAFQSITGRNPSWYAESGEKRELIVEQDTTSFPVDSVSHFDAVEFCDGLSRAEGLPTAYPNADSLKQQESLIGYRLPTEAEWEMCCRAGTRTQWYTGDDEQRLAKAAWTKSNANLHPQPVGSLAQNAFGLFDMSGNISEWCQDWFSPDEYSSRKGGPTNDPRGPSSGVSHVIRGGSFNLSPPASMSAMRNFNTPERKSDNYGFRLVLETEAARTLLQSSKAKSSSELQYTLNREAAEWIVSVGGQFQLTDGRWIAKLEDIPSSQFSIQDTNLAGCQNVDLQGYVKLAKLDRLAGLSCWDTPTNDDCLNALLGARNIQNALLAVSVIRCPISNSVTQSLANCPKLQTLTLSSTQISDIAFIKSLPNLIHLAVDGCPLSDDAIGTLADFDQLKSLTIDQSHFDQVVQKRNKAIDHLESLTVFTSENSTKMSSLPPTPNLHFLEVHASLPQEFALDWSQLAKIDKLSHLQLFNIEPNTLPSRSQFPSLEYLQLNHFKLGLPEIQSYLLCASTLQKIEIEQCHFGDDLIRHQQTMPELNIKIEMKSLTDQDADAAEAIARLLPNSQVTLNGQPIDH